MPPSRITVLHVDDEPGFADVAAEFLEREDARLDVRTATDPTAALDALAGVDCVVSDFEMPEMNGLAFLDEVRDRRPRVPFILFTGKGSEEVASDAISAGVTDYLQKGTGREQYTLLANRVLNAVEQRNSRASYHEIFEHATDGIVLVDPDTGAINDVNPAAADLFGYDRAALLDMTVGDLCPDDPPYTTERAHDHLRAAMADGPRAFEWQHVTKAGNRRWMAVRLTRTTINGTEQILATKRDVTEQRAREQRLAAQKAKVEALHDVAADVEASETPEDVYGHVCDAAEAILDYDRAIADAAEDGSLVPKAVPDRVPADEYYEATPIDAEDSLAARAYRAGESSLVSHLGDLDVTPADPEYESALTVPIGDYGIFQAVAEEPDAFGEADRELTELLVTHAREALARIDRETTLREQARELERQNDRLEEFAGVVSHDLRNPLNVAQGHLDLAREDCDSPHLDTAAAALARMNELVERTLSLARQGEAVGETERVSLAAVAREAWGMVSAPDATLTVAADATIAADPDRLQQLLENLFRNSVEHGTTADRDATRHDAAVEHGTRTRDADAADAGVTITVGALDDGFFVADDGPGIPPERRGDVFEPGYTTGETNTGFGLAIVDEIADAHRWSVDVTASEAGGARFEVRGGRG